MLATSSFQSNAGEHSEEANSGVLGGAPSSGFVISISGSATGSNISSTVVGKIDLASQISFRRNHVESCNIAGSGVLQSSVLKSKSLSTKMSVRRTSQDLHRIFRLIISYYFASFHTISYQFISFHIISYHFISRKILSQHSQLCHANKNHTFTFTFLEQQISKVP